ncbi:MAG: ribosome biogenesis GTPase YlqF [Spirochaetales bacterium]|nr:ribosome biogenesis GTPase YlqF [Spirochaetales bacterium]
MIINWYPGHMHKTRKEITESMSQTDVVIEILDARIPSSSRNPLIDELVKDKKRIIIINKSDLADPVVTKKWTDFFNNQEGMTAISISSTTDKNPGRIINMSRDLCKNEVWFNRRPVRAMIAGIPNVGKSTLINKIRGKKKADVGNKPAVTKRFQRVSISKGFELIDTPGVLWPKFEDQTVGYKLAILGSIKDSILDIQDIARFAYIYMEEQYGDRIKTRFKIDELPSESQEGITLIGKKRGFLLKGGTVDYDRACRLLIQEIRDGKLGKVSFDDVPEVIV